MKSVRCLSKEWPVTGAKLVCNEIRVAPTDQTILLLRALSNHGCLCEIPSRLHVEAKMVEPDLSIHQLVQHAEQTPGTSLKFYNSSIFSLEYNSDY